MSAPVAASINIAMKGVMSEQTRGTFRTPTNIHQSPAWSFIRTPGNGARMKSTVGVSTRDAVIGRATVGRTGNRAAQGVAVSFRGGLSWRTLSFRTGYQFRLLIWRDLEPFNFVSQKQNQAEQAEMLD